VNGYAHFGSGFPCWSMYAESHPEGAAYRNGSSAPVNGFTIRTRSPVKFGDCKLHGSYGSNSGSELSPNEIDGCSFGRQSAGSITTSVGPMMIPVEILSQLARPMSLAVRLFANMTAGHTVLAVLFGMTVTLPVWAGWVPFGFSVVIYGLELFIAFIQAYIFVMLSCVYFGDAEKMAH